MLCYFIFIAFLSISNGCDIPQFNFSISTQKNATGHWNTQVRLENAGGHPWDVYVDRTIVHFKDSQKSAIVATIIIPEEKFPGYDYVPGVGYYKVHRGSNSKNWIEAAQTCANDGAQLVIINSVAEAKAVINLLRKHQVTGQKPWVGVHDQYQEGDYVTIFNQKMQNTGFNRWHPNEPDGGARENCLWIYYYYHQDHHGKFIELYGLGDAPCMQGRPFICEETNFT